MKTIQFEEFKNAVIEYEESEKSSTFIKQSELNNGILIFKGNRKSKIVFISQHAFPIIAIKTILDKLSIIYNENEQLSDVIDFFSTENITKSEEEKINNLCYKKLEIRLDIIDKSKLKGITAFSCFFIDETSDFVSEDAIKAIYDYLAIGANPSEIKTSICKTIILFEIYARKEISIAALKDVVNSKLGNKIEDINLYINALKRNGKIAPSRKGGQLALTNEERQRIDEILKESNAIEKDFHRSFNEITNKYGISNNTELLNQLISLYKNYYKYNLDEDSDLENFNRTSAKIFTELKSIVANRVTIGSTQAAVDEIKNLCKTTSYLNRLSVSSSFLSLYKSNNLEQYINNRVNFVYFDTPAFIYYICAKSKYNDELEIWEDKNFKAVYNLIKCKEKNYSKIQFYISHDYIHETVGEFQKALRISWFDQFTLPIQLQTANTFYNYYQYIKKEKELFGEDEFTFIEFAKDLGFTEFDLESQKFSYKTYAAIKNYAQITHCNVVPPISETYSIFEEIKKEYHLYLAENYKYEKSPKAIDADIRQALYITNESLSKNQEYYLVSWDGSIRYLRDNIKELNAYHKTYAIYKPSSLVNLLNLKYFNIDSECITDELFAYADKTYDITAKVQNLFDDVIIPLFSASHKANGALVSQILKLQKEFIEAEDMYTQSSDRLPLEEFFLKIEKSLPEIPCSKLDLKEFLLAQENNKFITDLFETAFKSLADNVPFDIVKPFTERMRSFLDSRDLDIELGE